MPNVIYMEKDGRGWDAHVVVEDTLGGYSVEDENRGTEKGRRRSLEDEEHLKVSWGLEEDREHGEKRTENRLELLRNEMSFRVFPCVGWI